MPSTHTPFIPAYVGVPTEAEKYFVDTNVGATGARGKSWNEAFSTLTEAIAAAPSGSVIFVRGNINEQITTPLGKNDITVIGAHTKPRHADTHPLNGQLTGATWKIGSLSSAPLCIVRSPGWRFINILFAAHSSNYALRLDRTGVEDATEEDASHLSVLGCRFASGAGGISDTGGCFNVTIEGCWFQALTTACILGVGNIGVGQLMWHIRNNHFNNFTNGVKIAGHECVIEGNKFTDGGTPNTTYVLNTNNGGGRDNFIIDNFFQTSTANFNTPDVVGCATDVWTKNYAFDSTSAGVGGNFEAGQPA